MIWSKIMRMLPHFQKLEDDPTKLPILHKNIKKKKTKKEVW